MTSLSALAYARWKTMDRADVLEEAAVLFHLAVQIDAVRTLERLATLSKSGKPQTSGAA